MSGMIMPHGLLWFQKTIHIPWNSVVQELKQQ